MVQQRGVLRASMFLVNGQKLLWNGNYRGRTDILGESIVTMTTGPKEIIHGLFWDLPTAYVVKILV
jgi:hypothetical protein